MNRDENILLLNKEKISVIFLSLIFNSILLVSKLGVGFFIGSASLISEGIHSGMDMVAVVVALISVRQSSHPPDLGHHYGHGKFENLSGVVEAILIAIAAVLILKEAYDKIVHGATIVDIDLGIAIMAVSTVGNYIISRIMYRTARKTDSIALEADALNHRTDVLVSFGMVVGLIIIRFTGIGLIDPIMAIIVSLIIIRAVINLVIKSVRDLLDVTLSTTDENRIENIINEYSNNYLDFHDMRTRKSGSDKFIDFHLVVCRNYDIEKAHGIADEIEKEIIGEFPMASVLIHIEPCDKIEECSKCVRNGTDLSAIQQVIEQPPSDVK